MNDPNEKLWEMQSTAAEIYDTLRRGKMSTLRAMLESLRDEIGPRTVANVYVHDDVQKCLVFFDALEKTSTELLHSVNTLPYSALTT